MTRAARVVMAVVVGVAAMSCGGGGTGDQARATPTASASAGASAGFFPAERVTVRFGSDAQVRAEVAVTPAQLARGLMNRESLPADDGMLFLFQVLDDDGFYMKNTLIPLSIAYLRRTAVRTYRVVSILDMEPCPPSTADCPTYPPGTYYDATVEVNKGWFTRNGVDVGDTATIEGPIPNPFEL